MPRQHYLSIDVCLTARLQSTPFKIGLSLKNIYQKFQRPRSPQAFARVTEETIFNECHYAARPLQAHEKRHSPNSAISTHLDAEGGFVVRHLQFLPAYTNQDRIEVSPSRQLRGEDLLKVSKLLHHEAHTKSIIMSDSLRKAILKTTPEKMAMERFEGLTSKVGILQAQDSGTYAGLGVAGTDLGSRVALLQLDVARHGGEEETELEPTTGANLLYCGTTRRTVAQRIFEHDKCTTTAKANPDHLHNLHYSERAIAREFDYVVISSPVAAQTLERDEQLVIWELLDARFLGAWLGNTADVERCATTMPERRLRILGLNGTPIRKGLSNRVEATRFIAKTNPNQFWSEVRLVAETLPQMSQPVLVDWSSFSSERQGNIQDTQIEWRAAQLRALLDGSLLCRLHRGFS
ncbi:hypothetical protein CF327_g7662 [Tilletia walkeri]|nr:hypothetical protein CF327_g7662 [Tilletia walkeri]